MAWRDRLRRRAAVPDAADRPRRTERAGTGGPPGDGPDRSTSGAPGPSVPGDWDGGWRRAAPLQLTVARAPLGVSDGLVFRAGLAAWQNPSFDAGLGHALLPTAPTGLVRGVTPPAAPQPTRTGRGPLLLRALRPQGPDGPESGTSTAGAPNAGSADRAARPPAAGTPQISRRTRPGARRAGTAPSAARPPAARPSRSDEGGGGTAGVGSGPEPATARHGDNSPVRKARSGDISRTRGITSTESPATLLPSHPPVQRAAEPGTGPVVTPTDTGTDTGNGRGPAAPHIPLVRRVSVVPGATADAAVARSASGARASRAAAGAPDPDSGRRTSRSAAGSGSRTPPVPAVQRTATGPQSARGGRQQEATRAPGAEVPREVVRLRPVGPLPTVARRTAGPVRRLPVLRPAAVAVPDNGATPDAPGPASTVTEPEGPGTRSTAPAQRTTSRAPLGAPLSELPSTSSPLAADATAVPPAPGTGSAPGPKLPVVQHHSAGTAGASAPYDGGAKGTAPDAPRRTPGRRPGARARGGLGAPLSELPPSAGPPGSTVSGASAPRTASGPGVQRAPARQDRSSGAAPAPPTTDRDRTRTEDAPLAAPLAQGSGGADAPLLSASDVRPRLTPSTGAGDVQRSLADRASTGGTTLPGPTDRDHGNGPARPLVTPPRTAAPRHPAGEGAREGVAGAEGSAGNARRPGTASGGSGSGRQRPQGPSAPGPVVVARAPAAGTGAAAAPAATAESRTTGAVGPHPFAVTRAGAHSAPAPPRTLSLLAARPLRLNTRAPEGVAAPAASRSGSRPVVAARWPGTPAPHRSGPAQPSPGPSAAAPATPQVQRSAAGRPGPGPAGRGGRGTGSQGSVQRVPVVRPAPPLRGTHGAAAPGGAAPVRTLPVTAPQSQALAGRPPVTPAPAQTPAGTVPVVRPRTGTPGPAPAVGGTGRAAPAVQRDVTGAGDGSVPNGVPAKAEPERPAATTSAPGRSAAGNAGIPQSSGAELDELARRLLDPMARLLRTELRRGRDRTGRPYDGRR
ncbi:hypothetical protein P8A22_01345 [Streptomyces laculatispora]|uniref:Syndecan 1 n=1 Tax=Streptomyces laculatispora TaxID=887464 RepID=A0ABY9HXL5_9ACTN|nr:hypothetical protein [Streptomyces laculatispora]WLQ38804.1 hypothetical protein P8A22_01345 [Streptomyces laculatispora]